MASQKGNSPSPPSYQITLNNYRACIYFMQKSDTFAFAMLSRNTSCTVVETLPSNSIAWLLMTWRRGELWASCQIRKIADAPGMPGTFSPPPRVSDPDMHHGTCVTHVPWCMPGSLTIGFLWRWPRGKTFPAFPAHAQLAILRIW